MRLSLRRTHELHAQYPVGTPVTLHESVGTKVALSLGGAVFVASGVGELLAGGYPLGASVVSLGGGVALLATRRLFFGGLWLRLDDEAMTFSRPPFWSTLVVRWDTIAAFSTYWGTPSFCSFVLVDKSLAGTRSKWWRILPGINLLPTKYAGASSRDLAAYLEQWRSHAAGQRAR